MISFHEQHWHAAGAQERQPTLRGRPEAWRLPLRRFHDLRHACATLLLLQGEELKVVQEVLGLASYSTTAIIYAHVLPQLKRQAAAGMDAALRRRLGG